MEIPAAVKRIRWAELSLALVLMAAALVWVHLASNLPLPPFALASSVSPSYYPTAVAILLTGLSGLLLVRTLWAGRVAKEDETFWAQDRDPDGVPRVLLGMALFLVYVLLIPAIGFVLGSILFTSSFLHWVGRYSILTVILSSLSISGLLWVIFAYLLGVPLPPAAWGL